MIPPSIPPTLEHIGGVFPTVIGLVELFVGAMLIATGVIIGFFAASRLANAYYRYRSPDPGKENLALTHAFAHLDHEDWDPCAIPTTPNINDLASMEEYVLRLLIANGGRMKQSSLRSKTGWSQARVSRLLQRMEKHGDVCRVNVGRTNLIVLGAYGSNDEQS